MKYREKHISNKKCRAETMLAIIKIAAVSVCLGITLCMTAFFARADSIRPCVLRLHVLANSDSPEDQELKLKVRDRLLECGGELFGSADSLCEAEELVNKNIAALESAAREEIAENGFDYSVSVSLEKSRFNTRSYGDDLTLPAGIYDAVKVKIGSGEGHNWWCVMFPPVCVGAASDSKEMENVLNEEQLDVVSNGSKYRIGFKSVEIFEEIKEFLSK